MARLAGTGLTVGLFGSSPCIRGFTDGYSHNACDVLSDAEASNVPEMATTSRASSRASPRQVQVNFRQGARPLHGLTRVTRVDSRFGFLVGKGNVGVEHRMTPWELQARACGGAQSFWQY